MTSPLRTRPPVVDPRLRARRRDVRRDEGRRRLRRLQVALGAVTAVVGAGGLILSPVFDVDRIVVAGAARSGGDVVKDATGVDGGEAMLTLDLARVTAAVESLPWVERATVTRRWPGTLGVTVTERQPLAMVVARDGRSVVVDRSGRQLVVVDGEAAPELTRIDGLDFEPAPGATLGRDVPAALELIQLLPAGLSAGASRVTTTEGGLELFLEGETGNQTRVRFGGPSRLTDKMDALVALVDAGVLTEAIGRLEIDVRVPDAPVLTRSEG